MTYRHTYVHGRHALVVTHRPGRADEWWWQEKDAGTDVSILIHSLAMMGLAGAFGAPGTLVGAGVPSV